MARDTARTVAQIRNSVSEASIVEESRLHADAIHAIIQEDDIGAFYGALRQTGQEAEMKRDGDKIRGYIGL